MTDSRTLRPTRTGRREFIGQGLALGLAGVVPRCLATAWPSSSDPTGSKARRLTILHTADIHAQCEPHDEFFWEDGRPVFRRRGGLATLRSMVREIRSEGGADVLLVDGGDCFQGSGVASLSKGQAIVPLINLIGYDVMLPGNWEVVYGKAMMLKGFRAYTADKICANMFDAATGRLLFPPYRVFEVAGTKIGILGYNDPLTPIRQSPAYSEGIKFSDPDRDLARYVKTLRERQGCTVVFVLSHLGLAKQLDLASHPDASGVDYVLGGDTHERIRAPLRGQFAKVTEPGAFASFLGRLDLVIENGRIADERYTLLDVDPERYGEDGEMKTRVTAAKAPYQEELSRVIGTTKTPLFRYYVIETPMDNLITDALMWRFATDIVVSNGFRFCPPLVPPEGGVANITMDYLWSMLPVDSDVKVARVTGKQVRMWLEKELENVFAADPKRRFGGWFLRFKGMTVKFRINAPEDERVEEVRVGNELLDPDREYSLLACEREGDPDTVLCRMKDVREPTRLNVRLHQVMIEYLAKFSPVAPRLEGRAVAVDGVPTLLSQVEEVGYQFR